MFHGSKACLGIHKVQDDVDGRMNCEELGYGFVQLAYGSSNGQSINLTGDGLGAMMDGARGVLSLGGLMGIDF